MMILGVDSTSMATSVALVNDYKILSEFIVNDNNTHSQKLMPMIDSMLKMLGLSIKDIDALAVCIGPGSFTGIRIGLSTVKAFAHVNNIPIVSVNSLESVAYNAVLSDKIIVPILDAQKDNVYTAKYISKRCKLEMIEDIEIKNINDLITEIDQNGETYLVIGEGVKKHVENLKNIENIYFSNSIDNVLRGSSLCLLAEEKYRSGMDVFNCYDIRPLYMKKSQAEIQHEEVKKGK